MFHVHNVFYYTRGLCGVTDRVTYFREGGGGGTSGRGGWLVRVGGRCGQHLKNSESVILMYVYTYIHICIYIRTYNSSPPMLGSGLMMERCDIDVVPAHASRMARRCARRTTTCYANYSITIARTVGFRQPTERLSVVIITPLGRQHHAVE